MKNKQEKTDQDKMDNKFSVTSIIIAVALAGVLIGGATLFSNRPAPEPQTDNEDAVIPMADSQPFDIKTDGDLKVELATLKASLDNLYKAHNNLVNDHNTLLKYVNAMTPSNQGAGVAINSSDLDKRVTNLEKKLNDACILIFGVSSARPAPTIGCPSPQFPLKGVLEDRIKKLEGGY